MTIVLGVIHLVGLLFVMMGEEASGQTENSSLEGFIIPRLCVRAAGYIAGDGSNVSARPMDHTVRCALWDSPNNPPCRSSGYALMTPRGNGGEVYYRPAAFLDDAANTRVVQFLLTLPLDRKNVIVRLYGSLTTATQGSTPFLTLTANSSIVDLAALLETATHPTSSSSPLFNQSSSSSSPLRSGASSQAPASTMSMSGILRQTAVLMFFWVIFIFV